MVFTNMMEFFITVQLWMNVKQLASTTTRASLLIGIQTTLEKRVGFNRRPLAKIDLFPRKLKLVLTTN